jgi:rod shape-determining protein MreC
VKLRGGSALRLASAKAWLHRGTFVLLVGAAFALMVLGKADTPLIERARVTVVDALSPIMGGPSQVFVNSMKTPGIFGACGSRTQP